MSFDYTQLQTAFKEYLLANGDITQNEYDRQSGSVSIFTHMNEFKSFLQKEYDCSDVSIFSMNISDLLKLDIENGKIVDANAEDGLETDVPDDTPAEGEIPVVSDGAPIEDGAPVVPAETDVPDETVPSDADEAANELNLENIDLITNILNDLMQDDTIKDIIDFDSDGDISYEEYAKFLDSIKGYDNDDETISLEDIMGAINDIQEGTFGVSSEEPAETIEEPEASQPVEQTAAPAQTSSAPSSSGGSVGGPGGSSGSYSPSNSSVDNESLENKSVDFLQGKLTEAERTLSEKQDELTAIADGTSPELSGLKDNMDTALEDYNDALKDSNNENATRLAEVNTMIAEKEQAIQINETAIFNQKATVQQCTDAFNTASSNLESLEAQKAELESADTSGMSDSQAQAIQDKLSAIETAIENAQTAKDDAEKAKTSAEEELTRLEDEKETLENEEPTLEDLQTEKEELEGKLSDILAEEPLASLKQAYEDAKTQYETAQSSALSSAQKAVTEAQDRISEVNDALVTAQERENKKEYSPITSLQEAIDWARQYDDYSQEQMKEIFAKLGYQFDYNAWCADFVRMALGEGVGDENLPDWYRNISNKAYCPNIQNAGRGHEISAEEAQAGDIVLYDWNGDGSADHVGLFVDNGDGATTITAIEGNTSGAGGGSCVEEKARNRGNIIGIYSMRT